MGRELSNWNSDIYNNSYFINNTSSPSLFNTTNLIGYRSMWRVKQKKDYCFPFWVTGETLEDEKCIERLMYHVKMKVHEFCNF